MEYNLLNLVVICLLISTIIYSAVSSNECYICVSQKSWKDCNANLMKKNCTDSFYDACVDMYQVYGNKTYFIKRCDIYDQCMQTEDICRERNIYCKVKCCKGDLCNGNGSRGIHDFNTSYVLSICLSVLWHAFLRY